MVYHEKQPNIGKYTMTMDGMRMEEIDILSGKDLSNLTATQKELLSDRKSWPEILVGRNLRMQSWQMEGL